MQEMAIKNTRNTNDIKSQKNNFGIRSKYLSITTGFCSSLLGWLLGMFLASIIAIVFYPKQPQIAVIDINKIVNDFVKSTSLKKLAPDKMKEEVTDFGVKLDKELVAISKKQSLILLPSEAVIVGAREVTKQIQQNLR